MGLQSFDESVPWVNYAEILPSDTTAYTDLSATQRGILRADAIYVTSDDTIDHQLQWAISDGTNKMPIGTVVIPAGAGKSDTVPAVDLVSLSIKGALTGYCLPPFYLFAARLQVAMSADKTMQFTIVGGSV